MTAIKFNPKNTGFTLIELLVVIAIIGLLASVVLVSLNSARAKSRDAKRLADKKQIITAMNLYYNENSSWPSSSGWKCLGPAAETCWAGSFTGLGTLITALQPYLATFPTNNADSGTTAYDRMLYNSFYNTGATIIWVQENVMTSAICPGTIQHYDKYYYCYELIGTP